MKSPASGRSSSPTVYAHVKQSHTERIRDRATDAPRSTPPNDRIHALPPAHSQNDARSSWPWEVGDSRLPDREETLRAAGAFYCRHGSSGTYPSAAQWIRDVPRGQKHSFLTRMLAACGSLHGHQFRFGSAMQAESVVWSGSAMGIHKPKVYPTRPGGGTNLQGFGRCTIA